MTKLTKLEDNGPTRLADARLVRDLRNGAPGTFFTVWNGIAPRVWSVLIGVFDDERAAVGWANTFRLDLAKDVSQFTLDEPLGMQVGRALLRHLAPAVVGSPSDALPVERGETPDDTLRALPPGARLRYLVDLFFHVAAVSEPPGAGGDPEVDLAVLHLMEPGRHTDARRTAQSMLQRLPPDEVLLHPPGSGPPPGRDAGHRALWIGVAGVALCGLGALGIWGRQRTIDWATAADQCALQAKTAGFTGGSDPEGLSLALIRAGARVTLVEIPDLAPEGLALIGGSDSISSAGEAVLAFYTKNTRPGLAFWTLAHTAAGLPDDAQSPDGTLVPHQEGTLSLAGWVEPGGSWIVCGPAASPGAAVLATRIRDRRKAAVDAAERDAVLRAAQPAP